ncbi:hypothetical protein MRB53_022318 [Persea americana]|uniref:Uncharacterized protein n=1 Tax=Persea americana TaxID=3435 RepID=A0ACC2L6E1_PERAE|nr:hypothetical protein MRB53_022318 [Persea americana]
MKMDAESRKILPLSNGGDEDDVFEAVNRRIGGKLDEDGDGGMESRRLSPVLYREKLVKSFNGRGFLKVRNLAKISRPKKSDSKKKKKKTVDGEGEEEGGRWRGSTRLLLLDERYANSGVEDLPEAVKILEAVLPKGMIIPSAFETVGHISHLNLREEHLTYKKVIAQLLNSCSSNVTTMLLSY